MTAPLPTLKSPEPLAGQSLGAAPCSANTGLLEAFKAGAVWAAQMLEDQKTFYRFARGVGQGNDGPHNGKLEEVKQIILSAAEQLQQLPNAPGEPPGCKGELSYE